MAIDRVLLSGGIGNVPLAKCRHDAVIVGKPTGREQTIGCDVRERDSV